MPQYLSISRAARVVGIPRNSLQNKIKAGELASFDGMLAVEELLRVFPQVRLEDSGMLEQVNEIKERAFGKRVFERALPEKEVLAERLVELGKELASTKANLYAYSTVLEWLSIKLQQSEDAGGEQARAVLQPLRQWLARTLVDALAQAASASELMVRDSLLRILEAHVRLLPSGHEYVVEGSESILQSALRAGLALNYGCRDGSCGLCKARVVRGRVKQIRPYDFHLSETERQAGYVLTCAHTAVTDIELEADEARSARDIQQQTIQARVKRVEQLPGNIAVLHLHTPPASRLRFLAGQSVFLSCHGAKVQLPVASCPCEERRLEFHLFRQPALASLKEGEMVEVQGPHGECVLRIDSNRPILFVAYGTGFAPIKSLIEHAMAQEVESMHLYWLAADASGIYHANLCRAWADALDNFAFTPLLGDIDASLAYIVAKHPDLSLYDVYLSAHQAELDKLQSGLLRAGAELCQVYCD